MFFLFASLVILPGDVTAKWTEGHPSFSSYKFDDLVCVKWCSGDGKLIVNLRSVFKDLTLLKR